MKKIFFSLILLMTFSWASAPESYYYNGTYFSSPELDFTNTSCQVGNVQEGDVKYAGGYSHFAFYLNVYTREDGVICATIEQYNFTVASTTPPPCPAGEERDLSTHKCVPKPDPNKCNPFAGQYTSSSGQCTDCSSFGTVSGKSACACEAMGSSYVPQSVTPIYYESFGGKTYERQSSKCENGSSVPVYSNPVDTPKDTNGTSPTTPTNPTTPTTPTTPTDPNSGSGGTPTTPTTPTNPTNPTTPTTPTDPTTPTNPTTPTTPTTPSQADVINALNAIQNGQKDATTALKELGLDAKAIKEQIGKNGTTFSEMLTQMQQGNAKTDKMYQLMDDSYKGQVQIKNMMGKWIDADLENATKQLTATNATTGAVNATTNAINEKGDAIKGALDDILKAIKDGNGTDMSATNDKLDTLHKDNNGTQGKLDTLHNDLNSTNSLLSGIKGMFDNNNSFKAPDVNNSDFKLSDLLPSNSWFDTNKLKLDFNNYGGGCYCETAEFTVAGHRFEFPSQESLSYIPFTTISNIFMAFIYVLGLKAFLRN